MAIEAGISLDTILKIVEIASVLGGGGMVSYKLGKNTSRVEATLIAQNKDVSELKEDIKQLNKLMTTVAVQNQRLDAISSQISTLDRRYDELRHLKGFVMPAPAPLEVR